MGKSVNPPKDVVRERSEGLCERCGNRLTKNVNGAPEDKHARSIHHRQPKRCGGKDQVVNLVNICITCHRCIHADEKKAALEGWIVIGRYPGNVPFLSWRGWVRPNRDGSLTILDFDLGRAIDMPKPRSSKRVARRPRYRSRRTRQVA